MTIKRMTSVLAFVIALLALAAGGAVFAQEDSSGPVVATSDVYKFSDNEAVEGAFARLVRFENGVTTAISTSDLAEGEVYTLWWVVFNSPEKCSDGVCNLDDLFFVEDGVIPRDEAGNRAMNMDAIANADASVLHAAGGYAADGTFYTSASLNVGDNPGILFGPGLLDASSAEIHLVVRTHGAMIDDVNVFADQLSSFGGGCEPMDAPPCDDIQYAMFMPAQ